MFPEIIIKKIYFKLKSFYVIIIYKNFQYMHITDKLTSSFYNQYPNANIQTMANSQDLDSPRRTDILHQNLIL